MKILISSEVTEEIEDILFLLKSKNKKFQLFLLHNNKNTLINAELINKLYIEKTITKIKFLQKIYGLFFFIFIVFKEKPNIIFSGSSQQKHRFASRLFGIKHIAYFRGLMFDAKNLSGISDKLRFGMFKWIFQSKLFNAYEADQILTVGELNKSFIVDRGTNPKKIHLIGAVWLRNFSIQPSGISLSKIIFITQAFSAHGFVKQHEDQINFLKNLINWCDNNQKKLVIRIHPRDYFPYAEKIKTQLEIDQTPPFEFLKNSITKNDIIISPLSTMAFEIISLGGNCVFYSSYYLDKVYGNSYEKLSIMPIKTKDLDSLSNLSKNQFDSIVSNVFSPIKINFNL
jgi:hypothetical protein